MSKGHEHHEAKGQPLHHASVDAASEEQVALESSHDTRISPEYILHLQRTLGNRAVQRLIVQEKLKGRARPDATTIRRAVKVRDDVDIEEDKIESNDETPEEVVNASQPSPPAPPQDPEMPPSSAPTATPETTISTGTSSQQPGQNTHDGLHSAPEQLTLEQNPAANTPSQQAGQNSNPQSTPEQLTLEQNAAPTTTPSQTLPLPGTQTPANSSNTAPPFNSQSTPTNSPAPYGANGKADAAGKTAEQPASYNEAATKPETQPDQAETDVQPEQPPAPTTLPETPAPAEPSVDFANDSTPSGGGLMAAAQAASAQIWQQAAIIQAQMSARFGTSRQSIHMNAEMARASLMAHVESARGQAVEFFGATQAQIEATLAGYQQQTDATQAEQTSRLQESADSTHTQLSERKDRFHTEAQTVGEEGSQRARTAANTKSQQAQSLASSRAGGGTPEAAQVKAQEFPKLGAQSAKNLNEVGTNTAEGSKQIATSVQQSFADEASKFIAEVQSTTAEALNAMPGFGQTMLDSLTQLGSDAATQITDGLNQITTSLESLLNDALAHIAEAEASAIAQLDSAEAEVNNSVTNQVSACDSQINSIAAQGQAQAEGQDNADTSQAEAAIGELVSGCMMALGDGAGELESLLADFDAQASSQFSSLSNLVQNRVQEMLAQTQSTLAAGQADVTQRAGQSFNSYQSGVSGSITQLQGILQSVGGGMDQAATQSRAMLSQHIDQMLGQGDQQAQQEFGKLPAALNRADQQVTASISAKGVWNRIKAHLTDWVLWVGIGVGVALLILAAIPATAALAAALAIPLLIVGAALVQIQRGMALIDLGFKQKSVPWAQLIVFIITSPFRIVLDLIGISGLVEGIIGYDLVTWEKLSDAEREDRMASGIIAIVITILSWAAGGAKGLRGRGAKPRPATEPVLPEEPIPPKPKEPPVVPRRVTLAALRNLARLRIKAALERVESLRTRTNALDDTHFRVEKRNVSQDPGGANKGKSLNKSKSNLEKSDKSLEKIDPDKTPEDVIDRDLQKADAVERAEDGNLDSLEKQIALMEEAQASGDKAKINAARIGADLKPGQLEEIRPGVKRPVGGGDFDEAELQFAEQLAKERGEAVVMARHPDQPAVEGIFEKSGDPVQFKQPKDLPRAEQPDAMIAGVRSAQKNAAAQGWSDVEVAIQVSETDPAVIKQRWADVRPGEATNFPNVKRVRVYDTNGNLITDLGNTRP